MKPKQVYVQIVRVKGNRCVKQMGPFNESYAEKTLRGALINLNHEEYFVTTSPRKRKVFE